MALPWIITELCRFLFRIFQIRNFAFYAGQWYFDAIQYALIGVIIAMAQVWLMKTYRNITIPYWRIVTVIGWTIVGITLSVRVYDKPIIEKHLVMIGYFIMPILLQTLPMALTMRRGLDMGCYWDCWRSAIYRHPRYTSPTSYRRVS